jgi:ABC-type lipoprotein export system ATPase subunit
MAAIDINDLSLSYTEEGKDVLIFSHLHAHFGPNGLISILGESGTGKSSLLNILGGYLNSYQGEVRRDCDLKEISFVFQGLFLIDHLDVKDNAALPLILNGWKREEARKKALESLEEVGILDLKDRMVGTLSGGQKARVSLARCLSLDSKIILADEPTGSLDSVNSEAMMALFKKISSARLVIIVTHNEKLARRYSDEVYQISEASLAAIKKRQGKNPASHVSSLDSRPIRFAENIRLAFSFLKKRIGRVVSSLFFTSLCFGMAMSLLSLGLGGKEEIARLGQDCFDYSCLTLSEKKEYSIPGQEMKLIKKIRLSQEKENQLLAFFPSLDFYQSLDYFLSPYIQVRLDGQYLDDSVFFMPSFPSEEKLSAGKLPSSFLEVTVNKAFLSLKKGLGLGSQAEISQDSQVDTKFPERTVSDIVSLSFPFVITGIAKEKDLLSRPTVYYDYLKMSEYLMKLSLPEASAFIGEEFTIMERLSSLYSDENDSLTSFKTLVRAENPAKLKEITETDGSYALSSFPLEMSASLNEIIDSFSKIVLIFLVLALICSFLLELVVIESLYQAKKEEMAVFLSFHLSRSDFFRIGMGQIWILAFFLTSLSVLFALLFLGLGNLLLVHYSLSPFLSASSLGFYWLLIGLFSFAFAWLSGIIPLLPIYRADLVLSLKGE